MTTLDALHAALDGRPGDWQLRLAIADYHDEHGDPALASGYRALAANRVVCIDGMFWNLARYRFCWSYTFPTGPDAPGPYAVAMLPPVWFTRWGVATNDWHSPEDCGRREAEDAAARAFAAIPSAHVRAAILAGRYNYPRKRGGR